MLDFNETIAIVRTCVNANRADLIEDALFDGKTASDVRAMIGATIEIERPSRPATANTTAPAAASRSIFGDGPTPQQRDALAAAIKRRFEAETKRS